MQEISPRSGILKGRVPASPDAVSVVGYALVYGVLAGWLLLQR